MENLSTQDSLKIIQAVIEQRKQKYEENGFFLLFWAILIIIAGVSQFIMIKMGHGRISGWAWAFTMVPGFIVSIIVGFRDRQKKSKRNESADMHGWLWGMAGTLAMLTGFFFGTKFGQGFTAALFLPFCIAAMASALSLKNNLWITLTILGTVLAYSSLFIPFVYHPLVAAGVAFLIYLIPGIQLYLAHKKRQNV